MKIAALLALLGGGVIGAAEPAPGAITFDSFEYTGADASFAAALPPGHYRNPVLAGFYPDPSICRVGDDYYLINSTFAYFPGIPIFHSRDLVNWTQLGHVIDRAPQLSYAGLGVSRGIFAPAIEHHNGTFYVVCTMVDAGGNFLVTATDPRGPWSDPVWLGFDGIDPSLFFDDDGRAWLVNNGAPPDNRPAYDGHRAIWQQEFDPATKRLIGPRSIIVNGGVDLAKKPVWIEGPHLYHRGEWYYLCCAEGGTGDDHSQVIFRSRSVTGPFAPWDRNPILTQRDLDPARSQPVTCTGHADMVIGPDGNWWTVFLGCRPFAPGLYATGRETFLLPVTWTTDKWPVILPPGTPVPLLHEAPGRLTANIEQAPLAGNFVWRDPFDGPELSEFWVRLRASPDSGWTLGEPPGRLGVVPRADQLSGSGNPSFLARRVQHARFEASVVLDAPVSPGVSAGLAAFQSEKHHFFFGVRRSAGGLRVFLERAAGAPPEIVAHADLPSMEQIRLRVIVRDRACVFSWGAPAEAADRVVFEADAGLLTTQAAGGFVGAMIGLHARVE